MSHPVRIYKLGRGVDLWIWLCLVCDGQRCRDEKARAA